MKHCSKHLLLFYESFYIISYFIFTSSLLVEQIAAALSSLPGVLLFVYQRLLLVALSEFLILSDPSTSETVV